MKLYIPQLVKRIRVLVKEIRVLDLVKENQDLKRDQEYLLEEIDDHRFAKQKLKFVINDLETLVTGDSATACDLCRKQNSCTHRQFMVHMCSEFDYNRKPKEDLPHEE